MSKKTEQCSTPRSSAVPNVPIHSESNDSPINIRGFHEKPKCIEIMTVSKPQPSTDRTNKRSTRGKAFRDSEIRYRRLFEAARDGILILHAKTGAITDVNPYLLELLEYSREELLGKTLWDIGLFRDILDSRAAFLELISNAYVRYEDLPLRTKSGQFASVEFVSNVYRVNRKDVIQCNIRDISARRRAERTDEELRQAQKMETVGQLTGGIAHDFNNHLAVILGYCEMLEQRADLSEPTRRMIVEIHHAGTSAKDLTRHLLTFSRRQVSHPILLDLNACVNHLQPMLNRLIGDEVKFVSSLGSQLGRIRADPIQIEQVLMNLAVNARDAMPKGGTITIETANVETTKTEADDTYVRHNPSANLLGSCVMLTVTDTGVGMDKLTQTRVFEPFFSTKEVGKGTGLGLSTVFGIIKQIEGTICVRSELGRGTRFTIYFPQSGGSEIASLPEKMVRSTGGTETILLVDDATHLRGLTRQLLEECGYHVLDSGDPEDALRIAAEYKGPVPLMITDVVMPVLNGPALAIKLAESRPETRVLFMSGYANDEIAKYGILGQNCAFLEKPFSRDDLIKAVRDLLDSPLHLAA